MKYVDIMSVRNTLYLLSSPYQKGNNYPKFYKQELKLIKLNKINLEFSSQNNYYYLKTDFLL